MPIRRRARPGDHLVVCDRTGFTRWASETQKEWNGALVDKKVWEARHPQDFVRGVRDDARVDPARPSPTPADLPGYGPKQVALAVTALAGYSSITVPSISGFSVGDLVRVFLDVGDVFQVRIASTSDPATLGLASPLPGVASAGNYVINISNVSGRPALA